MNVLLWSNKYWVIKITDVTRTIKLKGEDVAEGLRDWVKSELKEGPKQGYDLGKFLFSVSVGTIGALTAIEKLNATPQMDLLMICSLFLLFISIVIALLLALPRKNSIRGETDLFDAYEKQIQKIHIHVWIWFIIWISGTFIGVIAIGS